MIERDSEMNAISRADLEQKLAYLKSVKRLELAESIRRAIQTGDLSEGSQYDRLKTEQERLEADIRGLEAYLRRTVVDDLNSDDSTGNVRAGSEVHVIETNTQQEAIYHLVPPTEENPFLGKISVDSPIAKALLGQSVGQEVELNLSVGKLRYKIIGIK